MHKKNKRMFLLSICFIVMTITIILTIFDNSNLLNVKNKYKKKEFKNDSIELSNALIRKTSGEDIVVIDKGEDKTYKVPGLKENITNVLADIIIKNGKVSELKLKKNIITGKVLSVDNEGIEIDGYGKVMFTEKFRVYLAYNDYMESDINSIVVGNENVSFIVDNKKICGAFVNTTIDAKNIRVLIKTTGFSDYLHNNVKFSVDSPFNIKYYESDGNGNYNELIEKHEAGEEITITPENPILSAGRIEISPELEDGKIFISSIERGYGNPGYHGSIEISIIDGKLGIVNELPVEKYLYAVVPSEMPLSYGNEALKVQAICARSYAISHLNDSKLSKYGANIDDSTDYQVYNNSCETEDSIRAVNDTYGQILMYGNDIASTYFYATSCGATTDGTVWGGQGAEYLKSKMLCSNGSELDLQNNSVFCDFIKNNYETYDSGNPWYRWSVNISCKRITECVNDKITEMYNCDNEKILTWTENCKYESKKVYTVGNVTDMNIVKRGPGGIAEELIITGDKGSIKVIGQSNIRNLLNPYGNNINKADGTTVNTFNAMPSAFFVCEKSNNDSFNIYGGGFGHGAGMSQTAVKKMVEKGMKYCDILQFFYEGTEVNKAYD